MYSPRVIPTLLLKNGGVVKTVQFSNPKYIGDPINTVKIFNQKEVDELMIVDIEATTMKRGINWELLEDISSEAFMPLSYGGGIKSLDDMKRLFFLGFEKIIVNSLIHENINLVKEAAKVFGSQSVVASIDVKKSFFGGNDVYLYNGKKRAGKSLEELLSIVEEAGVGEICLNSIHRDGICKGYDLELIKSVSSKVSVPVIALGGAGSINDLKSAIDCGASAVAAGSLFVFQGIHKAVLISYPDRDTLDQLFSN